MYMRTAYREWKSKGKGFRKIVKFWLIGYLFLLVSPFILTSGGTRFALQMNTNTRIFCLTFHQIVIFQKKIRTHGQNLIEICIFVLWKVQTAFSVWKCSQMIFSGWTWPKIIEGLKIILFILDIASQNLRGWNKKIIIFIL
jgi:hypothetical protein